MTNTALHTNDGKKTILDRYANDTPSRSKPSKMWFGANDQSPAVTDTALDARLPKSPTTIDACDATTGWANAGDGDAETLNTTSGERREGTGCLNLPSTYSTGTSSWSKTIAGTDVSSSYVLLQVYFSTAAYSNLTAGTDTVRIYLGTGGFTDANYYDFDKTNIRSNDWTVLYIDVESPTGTDGSGATTTNVDSIKIQYKAGASIGTNNARMDYWVYAADSEFDVSMTTSYPVLDYSGITATYRARVGANQMNSFKISNAALMNGDSTELLQLNSQFDEQSKTDKVVLVAQPKITIS